MAAYRDLAPAQYDCHRRHGPLCYPRSCRRSSVHRQDFASLRRTGPTFAVDAAVGVRTPRGKRKYCREHKRCDPAFERTLFVPIRLRRTLAGLTRTPSTAETNQACAIDQRGRPSRTRCFKLCRWRNFGRQLNAGAHTYAKKGGCLRQSPFFTGNKFAEARYLNRTLSRMSPNALLYSWNSAVGAVQTKYTRPAGRTTVIIQSVSSPPAGESLLK